MRKSHLALGLFLLFFLFEFSIPTITVPEVIPTTRDPSSTVPFFSQQKVNPIDELIILPSKENAPPVPDHPLGSGRETLVEWWNTSYDFRRKVTIIEPDITSRTMEPVNIYLTFAPNTARNNIIAVAYWDLATWHEVPSQIWNATLSGNYYDSCTVCFLVNISQNYQEVIYIYYDNDAITAPSYTDHIEAIPTNGPATDDTLMPWVWSDVTSTNYTSVDTIFIRSSASQYEHSAILLVDTLRGGSDWGGPCCGLITARYGDADAFDTSNGTSADQYMLLGEFALDPYLENPGMESVTRANVAPDNPAEAWVPGAGVWILDDGPLFTRIKIVTSDGGYETSSSPYPSDPYQDSDPRTWGSHGFFNYTIIYTFYWHGDNLFVNILLDIEANPQETGQQCAVKNYGDWPHIMTFTCGIGTPGTIDARQNRKSWNGSKYGLYNESVDGRRRDFPIEPWMVWYDNASGTDPSVGIAANVNPVGWEVLSLAVTGMGDNTMLQQILREGHQGDFFVMPDGDHFIYDYTIYTSAYGTNFTELRSLSMQVNQPVTQTMGEQELYAHNVLTCITKDVANANISNVTVYLYNSTTDLVRSGTTEAATITFVKLPSDTYTIVSNYTLLSTYGGSVTFLVNSTSIAIDHTIQRGWSKTIECQLSYLTIEVRDWYDNTQLPTYAEVFLDDTLSGAPIFALNASPTASIYMFPAQYDLNVRYINRFRLHNQTAPITVGSSGDTNIVIGIVAREHRTELELKAPSTVPYIEIPYNVTRTFLVFYKDLDSIPPGMGVDVGATSVPFIANWTLYNSTADIVDSGTLTPVLGEVGNFSMSFDASLYLVNETYQLRFFLDANAPVDYWQAFLSVSVVIRGREVQIVPESTSYSVYWNDTFTFAVYLNDTAENTPILGATPQYFGIGFSGKLLPNGTDGWYSTSYHVENISIGTYTITIRAQIAAYEDATSQILLYVAPQPTTATLLSGETSDSSGLVNNSLALDDIWVPVGDYLILTFNYTGMWNQQILDAIGQISYQVGFDSIEYIGNGLYRVVIDTSTLPIGSYAAAAGFSKQNFDVAILSFTIEVRMIPTDIYLLNPALSVSYYERFVGDLFRIRVNFTDTWHKSLISGASLFVDCPGLGYVHVPMVEVAPGLYELPGFSARLEGIFDITISGLIENHNPAEFVFQLRVETHPIARQAITYGLIAAIVGIFILIAWLAYTRVFAIPWLVRKMRKMSTTLGKGRTPKLSGGDRRRINTRPDQMKDFMQDAYGNAKIPFVSTSVPLAVAIDEREAEEVNIWHELDQLKGLGRDQKLELFEEMKRIPPKDRIWFLEDLKRQLKDGTRFARTQVPSTPEGLLDESAEKQLIQSRLDAIPALSEREKKALFRQISNLPPEEREEVFETLKEQYKTSEEEEE
ncbi:MAG: hypothetical protein ACFFD8_04805 [Candidatus Thorarchaeota archaeon]